MPRILYRWLFSAAGSVGQRTARAGIWLVIGDGLARSVGIVKFVVLGRLLTPADFGVIGIALLVTSWVEYFTEVGFSAALIQKRGDIRPYLDTAWTAQIVRAGGLTCALIAGAAVAGWFFTDPRTVPVIQVLALKAAIWGFTNPAVVYLRKDLETRREVLWRLIGAAAGLAVGIPAAIVLRNVWALVLSVLAASTAEVIASYWVRPYRPALSLDWNKARELVKFGRWMFPLHVVSFTNSNLSNLVLAKLLGATPLGLYQMAHRLTVTPISTIGLHFHGVMFPAFSAIDDEARLRLAFLWTLSLAASIAVPLGFFFVVFGDALVLLTLGPAWASIEPLVRILPWTGVCATVSLPMSALLMAMGTPRLDLMTALPKLLILLVGLYPATMTLGPIGVAITVTAGGFAGLVCQAFVVRHRLHVPTKDFLAAFKVSAYGSLPFLACWLLASDASPVAFIAAALLAIAAYLAVLLNSVRALFAKVGSVPSLRVVPREARHEPLSDARGR